MRSVERLRALLSALGARLGESGEVLVVGRSAVALQIVAGLMVLVLSLALVPWLLRGELPGAQAAGSVTAVALGLACIWLLRRGRHRAGVLVLAAAVWAHVAWPMVSLGLGYALMGTRFAVLPLALVALLLGRRDLWVTFLAFAAAAVAGAARDTGLLGAPAAVPVLMPTRPLLATLVLYLAAALLLDRLAGALRGALAEALRGNEALRERDEIMRVVFEVYPDAAALIRAADGQLIACNQGLVELAGAPRERLLGQDMLAAALWEDAAAEAAFLARAAQDGAVTNVETRLRGTGGEPVTALASARRLSVRGEPHVLVVTRNISDWKRSQDEREAMREELRQAQKMEAIGRLAGGVAHDFNNLLTSILGSATVAEEALPSGHPARPELEQIATDGRRAADLTRQLLSFARKEVVTPRLLAVDEVVAGMAKLLRRVLGEHVALETRLAAPGALVFTDQGQLEQVVLNLAVNARDAMPSGGRLVISTETRPAGAAPARVVLVVRDEGVGIPAEILPHLFEPFYTTKPAGHGTGLGLATCHGIVARAGGEITVASTPGQGTCFEVRLPRAWGEKPAAPAAGAGAQVGSETVLVVDDQPSVRAVAARILRSRGYALLEAGSVAEATRVLAAHAGPVHLALLDVGLPDGSGRAVADLLAGTRPGARVLFTSGHPEDEVVRRGVADASFRYLRKPYGADELARAVRRVLDEPAGAAAPLRAAVEEA